MLIMKILKNTSHLCGHFLINDRASLVTRLEQQGWVADKIGKEVLDSCKNYYYSEFVEFTLHGDGNISKFNTKKSHKDALSGLVRYNKTINRKIRVRTRSGDEVALHIEKLTVYIAPFNIVLFSVDLTMEDIDYNHLAAALQLIRDNCHYDESLVGEFIDAAITPICNILSTTEVKVGTSNYQELTKNGNKLKLFQINETDSVAETDGEKFDAMLYSMGCLMPIDDSNCLACTDTDYYKRVMQNGRIAVFDGWRALALFDTFSMMTVPLPDFRRDMWNSDYFRMIYIYILFRQAFLYQYESLFRKEGCDIKSLESDILLFERRYCFDRFSFNFLPIEIGRAMERALELRESSANLHSTVAQASAVYEKESDDKMNRVLTLLAVITICSTIWDLFSMLNEAFPFNSSMSVFRTGTYILIIILLIISIIYLQSNRKH